MKALGIDLNSKTLAAVLVEKTDEEKSKYLIKNKFFLNIDKKLTPSQHACHDELLALIKEADIISVESQRGRATALAAIEASIQSVCFILKKKCKSVSSLSKFSEEEKAGALNYNKKRKLAIRLSVNLLQHPGLFSANCLSFLFFSRKKQDDAADAFLYAYNEVRNDDESV